MILGWLSIYNTTRWYQSGGQLSNHLPIVELLCIQLDVCHVVADLNASAMLVVLESLVQTWEILASFILLLQFCVILQTSHFYVYLPQTLCKMSVLPPEIALDNSRRLRISAQMVDTGEKMTPKKQILIFLSWLCLSIQGLVDEWQHPDDGKQG